MAVTRKRLNRQTANMCNFGSDTMMFQKITYIYIANRTPPPPPPPPPPPTHTNKHTHTPRTPSNLLLAVLYCVVLFVKCSVVFFFFFFFLIFMLKT